MLAPSSQTDIDQAPHTNQDLLQSIKLPPQRKEKNPALSVNSKDINLQLNNVTY